MAADVALSLIPLGPGGGLAGIHGLAGLLTLTVGLLAGLAGVVLKGRWRPRRRYNKMQAHYILTGLLSAILVIVFSAGTYLMWARGLPYLRTLHGLNGLLLVGATVVSLVTSPCITRRYFFCKLRAPLLLGIPGRGVAGAESGAGDRAPVLLGLRKPV